MSTYLVRRLGTHEAVGLYSAADDAELSILVDELIEPSSCEYAPIPSGGIVWPSRDAKAIPARDVDWQSKKGSPLAVIGVPSTTERWFFALTDEKLEFRRFFQTAGDG